MTENEEVPSEEEEQPNEEKREPIDVTVTDIELEELKQEAAEFKDKYIRLLAEQENTRKRLMKERDQLTRYAKDSVIIDFLTPIDHMENALKCAEGMSEDVKHWAVGFEMILTQLKDVIADSGIKPITSVGRPYDPHFHEVLETVETEEHPPGTIITESLKGYVRGDKAVRPARVTVAKAPEEQIQEITGGND